jgi:molecular chaperone GrpE (heat shock protein)
MISLNYLPELEQKNRTISEKVQLIDTISNELEDVRAELDMLKADFQDYREQVARDKAEADESAARTVPLANAAAAKNREDRNGGSQLRFKR